MKYLTGIYAVNLSEPGDITNTGWHGAHFDWDNAPLSDSRDSVFGMFQIERRTFRIGGKDYTWQTASHLRACLDMIEKNHLVSARGMREDYIGNELLTPLLFEKVDMLRGKEHWCEIDDFMGKEYLMDWVRWKEANGHV